ncbi:F-box/LRR-repeat protein 3 [Rhynchospora pubera]|uniref:F-box/LRR-repeat protein 3 n=1 Tax=Rhynchospora pubera TaxID=906938 RepID=A0AAV8GV71_9POAL|nr:F-box/LRR-repeat protein 3 [Rhynchospora pubera]
MKKRIRVEANTEPSESPFEVLSEEILFLILDLLDSNPLDKKSFSLVSRSFFARIMLLGLRKLHNSDIGCNHHRHPEMSKPPNNSLQGTGTIMSRTSTETSHGEGFSTAVTHGGNIQSWALIKPTQEKPQITNQSKTLSWAQIVAMPPCGEKRQKSKTDTKKNPPMISNKPQATNLRIEHQAIQPKKINLNKDSVSNRSQFMPPLSNTVAIVQQIEKTTSDLTTINNAASRNPEYSRGNAHNTNQCMNRKNPRTDQMEKGSAPNTRCKKVFVENEQEERHDDIGNNFQSEAEEDEESASIEEEEEGASVEQEVPLRRSTRFTQPPARLQDFVTYENIEILRNILIKYKIQILHIFFTVEARHRRSLTPLRPELLPFVLSRYNSISHLNLTLCPYLSDASLSSIASLLGPSLRSINLSGSRSYSHRGIESLANKCFNLEEIDVSNGVELTDEAAAAIGRMSKVERVRMGRCKKVTDLGIGCIAVCCPNLKLLCLKGCVGVTDLGVALIAVKCRKLRSLDVSFTMITKKCLPAIAQLPNLEDLCMTGCLGINDKALVTLKQGFKSLQVNSMLSGLHGVFKLNSIKLDGCHVSTDGLKSLANSCISLKELSLSKCSGVTDEGISVIVAKHKDLMKLDATCCRYITDLTLAAITSSCASLVSLSMESCTKVTCEGFRLIGRHCPKLEELNLTDTDLDDEGLTSLSQCRNLTSLKIGICLKITDEGLIQIGRSCPHLQELDLYRSIGITDKGVSEIARGCSNLETICMSYCTSISDESLKCLSNCARLNTLEIRGCSLVSSVGISAIAARCCNLSKLDIKKCYEINDAAMLSFARFSHNLRQINLSYCSVTDVGVSALASISCLQVVTMLHLSGMSADGLAAALLMCGSLMKVKLHVSFKPFISPVLINRVESRGCMFQWLNKPFQVQLESSEVWKQQSHDIFVE